MDSGETFEVKDKKLTIYTDKQSIKQFLTLFKDKFKDILGLDMEVKETEEKDKKSQ